MSFTAILRDTNGDPIPQYYDTDAGVFKPLTEAEISALAGVAVSGTVEVSNQPTEIDVNNFPATQTVDGAVDVNNFPSSIEEHMWVDGDAEPTPTAARAIGLVFDPGTDDVTVKIWTGAAWEVM